MGSCYIAQRAQLGALWWPRGVRQGVGERCKREGIYIYIYTYLLHCTAETASQVELVVKNLPANAGDRRDAGSILGLGKCPGGGHGDHSSILAYRIPWMWEPGGLWSIGLQRAGHNWSDLAHMHARQKLTQHSEAIIPQFKKKKKKATKDMGLRGKKRSASSSWASASTAVKWADSDSWLWRCI